MTERRRLRVRGAVQGVGFRPFAHQLASEIGLTGYVINSPQGAEIEVEGRPDQLDHFAERLRSELPAPGSVAGIEQDAVPAQGDTEFEIRHSTVRGPKSARILPDLAPCPACLAEMRDRSDRRYGYPFINCTHCGPRVSIVTGLPYDRPNTSMAGFPLCPDCLREYEDPRDRRFHAQPIACPVCGPHVELWNGEGQGIGAIPEAAEAIRAGKIVALKAVGGFQLLVDAGNEAAVLRLRERKRRESKPLAVMVRDLAMAHEFGVISPEEEALLTSVAAPIVLVPSKGGLADAVAPENPNVGLMLPSSPLHVLLMEALGIPVVATSGNLTDEPLCTDEHEALRRLAGIADCFLVHNRPIVRPIDDSVCRVLGEGPSVLRRARGYAPLYFPMEGVQPGLLATGAHLKGSVAVTGRGQIILGQHLGDLDHVLARRRLEEEARDLSELQGEPITRVACDLHPDYYATVYAHALGLPVTPVQHHVAHAMALVGEHGLNAPALIVVWDGTGLGPDGTIWGGEFLLWEGETVRRVAHLRPFLLPGGDAAARQGHRSALGALHALGAAEAVLLTDRDAAIRSLLNSSQHCTKTTSAGRLFDAAAALGAGILESRFEGDAAMRWEALADPDEIGAYPVGVTDGQLDWGPTLLALREDPSAPAVKSARFHRALANGIVQVAQSVGCHQVGLSGGCFQNQLLAKLTCEALRQQVFVPIEHRQIPPNDGGVAFGQAVAAERGIVLLGE